VASIVRHSGAAKEITVLGFHCSTTQPRTEAAAAVDLAYSLIAQLSSHRECPVAFPVDVLQLAPRCSAIVLRATFSN
jgi:hypothetical protein